MRDLDYTINVSLRNLRPFFRVIRGARTVPAGSIVGMIRLRNEQDLLQDTLDHLSGIVDGIVVFDDASTDRSREIAVGHPHVIEVIVNRHWRRRNRIWEETANRRILYARAKRHWPAWVFYSDADERFVGDIRSFLQNAGPEVHGLRVNLFDAYMTPEDHAPHREGQPLLDFRSSFGPEQRRILMAWRPEASVDFTTRDAREPQGVPGPFVDRFECQHYGKALSEAQWEETCRYYVDNFPVYRDKWLARMGKALHTESDFGTPLYSWVDVTSHAVDI
ncbi:glycosyltransferase family 2 protein [uncultured Leifsonia sp.]|uniref:glycosyltransferase family 2 protein n=1 Tax=uncultured Leifsonia sp. TaxID=340359 RepID=UPI0025EC92EA|nr:glycosyltransferase family 2 protein [uncultured Leifsonia sp.]